MPNPKKIAALAGATLLGGYKILKTAYHGATDQKRLKNINKVYEEGDGNLSNKQKKFLKNFHKSDIRKHMNTNERNPNTNYLNNVVVEKMGGSVGPVGPNGVL